MATETKKRTLQRTSRELDLDAEFGGLNNTRTGWFFAVGLHFRDALDIRHKSKKDTVKLKDGSKKTTERWLWAEAVPAAYSFDLGDTLYENPKAVGGGLLGVRSRQT